MLRRDDLRAIREVPRWQAEMYPDVHTRPVSDAETLDAIGVSAVIEWLQRQDDGYDISKRRW